MSITFEAYRELLALEYPLFKKAFPAIYDRVRRAPLAVRSRNTLGCTEIPRSIGDRRSAAAVRCTRLGRTGRPRHQ